MQTFVVSAALGAALALGGLHHVPFRAPAMVGSGRSHIPESPMTMHARGTFEVQIAPLPADAHADGATMGRMTIDKQFTGDLVGTGKGQMLTGMGAVKGSAAYVAMERVTGSVHGRSGSFILHHTGVMQQGVQTLRISVAPDSGTGDLTGIAGTLMITIEGKVHSYDFEYTLPSAP